MVSSSSSSNWQQAGGYSIGSTTTATSVTKGSKNKNDEKFKFKGFSLNCAKSLQHRNAAVVNLKLPLTGNFLEYDKIHFNPRVFASVGVGMNPRMLPANIVDMALDYRLSFAASIPMISTIFYIACLFTKLKLTRHDFVRDLHEWKDPNRRVGVSLGFKYNPLSKNGVSVAFGPWVQQYTPKYFMDVIMPFFVLFPSLFITVVNFLCQLINPFTYLDLSEDEQPKNLETTAANKRNNNSNNISNPVATALVAVVSFLLKLINPFAHIVLEKENLVNSGASSLKKKRFLGWDDWHASVLRWFVSKNPVIAFLAGYNFDSRLQGTFGTTSVFEIGNLYPLASEIQFLQRLLSKQKSPTASTTTSPRARASRIVDE